MGYTSTVTGRIEIVPPLRDRDFDRSMLDANDVTFEVAITTEEVAEGTLTRKSIVAIVPAIEDSYKAYDLGENLRAAVVAVYRAGSECTGEIRREGEDQGDVERFRIVDGSVLAERARLVWPDGTPVQPS